LYFVSGTERTISFGKKIKTSPYLDFEEKGSNEWF
jgi:hypothetical protein